MYHFKNSTSFKKVFFAVWLSAALSLGLASITFAEALQNVKFPSVPETVNIGDTLRLKVKAKTKAGLQYRWLTKYGAKDWLTAKDWSNDGTFSKTFKKPGMYSVQVDVKKGEQVIQSRWLGQTQVQAELVTRIIYLPMTLTPLVGTPVSFMMSLGDYPLENLEFRLLAMEDAANPEWKVVQDFRPWPLEDFSSALPMKYDLQVDVRTINDHTIVQKIWLGTFYFSARFPHNNLIRGLSSDDFNIASPKQGIDTLAKELWLAVNLLKWEFEGRSSDEQLKLLQGLKYVKAVQYDKVSGVTIFMQSGREYFFNLSDRTFQQGGSSQSIALSLKNYPEYREVFNAAANLPDDMVNAAAVTYAVYSGYRYGVPAYFIFTDLADGTANCATLTHLLFMLLKGMRYDRVYFVGLGNVKSGMSHTLLQIYANDKKPYLLDPTIGFMYLYDIRDVKTKDIPPPLIFPQKAEFKFLDLRNILKDKTQVNVWLGDGLKETAEKGIISTPLPKEFISGDCKSWVEKTKALKVWNIYNAVKGLCRE